MVFIGMGTALIIMDATIVNVSLPSMIADLGLSSIDAEWVNAIYSLTFAALLIVFGRIGDRVGRRRIFTLGALVFVAASIYAASSRSGDHLITARALQGIGKLAPELAKDGMPELVLAGVLNFMMTKPVLRPFEPW